MSHSTVQFRCATPTNPGAIAIFDLVGDCESILQEIIAERCGRDGGVVPVGRLRLLRITDSDSTLIDEAVVARPSATMMQLMLHGGPRIVQRVRERLGQVGAIEMVSGSENGSDEDVHRHWPEAASAIEALALEMCKSAQSRDAIPLLLRQRELWRRFLETNHRVDSETLRRLEERARILRRLLDPPVVTVVGPPNVGKSTLTNALVGRSTSIESPIQGTTRDYVGTLVDLAGLTVWWFDTPGRRRTDDAIEAEAIRLSDRLVESADLLVHAISPDVASNDLMASESKRGVDLRVLLKSDLAASPPPPIDLSISVRTGAGIREFVRRIREALVPADLLESDDPWLFDPRLRDRLVRPTASVDSG